MDDEDPRNWSPEIVRYERDGLFKLGTLRSIPATPAGSRLTFQLTAVEAMADTPASEHPYDLGALQGCHPNQSPNRQTDRADTARPHASCFLFGRSLDGASVCVQLVGLMPRVYVLWDGRSVEKAVDFLHVVCHRAAKAQQVGLFAHRAALKPADLLWAVVERSHLMDWDPADEDIAAAAEWQTARDAAAPTWTTPEDQSSWERANPPVPLPPRTHRYLELFLPDEEAVQLVQAAIGGRPAAYGYRRSAEVDQFVLESASYAQHYPLYESKHTLATQMFARSGIRPGEWMSVPWDGADASRSGRYSHCDLEVTITLPNDLAVQRSIPPQLLTPIMSTATAPLTLMSFDIETVAGTAPNAFRFADSAKREDEVVMISATVDRLASTARPLRVVLTTIALKEDDSALVRTTLADERAKLRERLAQDRAAGKELVLERRTDFVVAPDVVVLCACESDLLAAWRALVIAVDPDVLTGYDIFGHDFDFLNKRAAHQHVEKYFYQSRLIHQRCRAYDHELNSKAYGQNAQHLLPMGGRIAVDMLFTIKVQHKLDQYTLDATAHEFLGLAKTDMPYAEMHKIVRGRDAARGWEVVLHATADADLPLFLMLALKTCAQMLSMAAVTKTLPQVLCTQGQQIRAFNQLLVACSARGVVLDSPYVPKNGAVADSYEEEDEEDEGDEDDEDENKQEAGARPRGYEGAIILPMVCGYYTHPVATGDVNSMYPSIMISHNLCYSTRVRDPRLLDLAGVKYHRIQVSDTEMTVWVHQQHYRGIFPSFLVGILAERKAVRKEMEQMEVTLGPAAKESLAYSTLDSKQLALKVTANAAYGFTGVRDGYLPMKDVAASVTAKGRELLLAAQTIVETQFQPAQNPAYPASRVIAGDTDSIMIYFPEVEPTDAGLEALWAHVAAMMDSVTDQLREGPESRFRIETEAIAVRSLFVRQKKYAFKFQARPNGPFNLKERGLDTVRRDSSPVLRMLQKKLLTVLMDGPADTVRHDVELALCEGLAALCERRVPLDDYVMTKELKGGYKTPQPHALVVAKQRQRQPGAEVAVGQRVPFVYIEGAKKDKRCDLAEDPDYVRAHPKECAIDREWYFARIESALAAMLQSVSPDAAEALFAPYRSDLRRQRDGAQSLFAAFGAAGADLTPEAVVGRAEQLRKRRKVEAPPKVVIADARAAKAAAKTRRAAAPAVQKQRLLTALMATPQHA